MKIHHVGHVPKGWIFSYIHNNDDLQDIHCKSFKILRNHILDEEIPREIDFTRFNEDEKNIIYNMDISTYLNNIALILPLVFLTMIIFVLLGLFKKNTTVFF